MIPKSPTMVLKQDIYQRAKELNGVWGPGFVPEDTPAPKAPSSWSRARQQPSALKKNKPFYNGSAKESQHMSLQELKVDRRDLIYDECVGSGRTAKVYRGMWKGRIVAVKEMNLCAWKPAQTEQELVFLRETVVSAKISHTNLVQFYGLACETHPLLLITEFCSGGNCFNLLHEDDLELVLWQKLKIISDVAHAMNYLHQLQPQIIHRDLKSLNLLLCDILTSQMDTPHVKVSDFGLAKMKDKDGKWAKMTANAGTCQWMAPEVSTGQYDEKVDVYSFAIVVYECICQEIPFGDLEPAEVLDKVMAGSRPDVEFVPAECPRVLLKLMQYCWAHEPSNRPAFAIICKILSELSGRINS